MGKGALFSFIKFIKLFDFLKYNCAFYDDLSMVVKDEKRF